MLDFNNSLNDFLKVSVVTDDVTLKTKLNRNNSRFDELSLYHSTRFNPKLGLYA